MAVGSKSQEAGLSRRDVLRDAGAAGAALALTGSAGALARPRRRRRQTVAVFGGGIAGLTTAHELAERGFDVTVYESRAWGGKARSTEVPGSARGGRQNLPGEHGWRTFFGFYQNTADTLRRIPFESNPNGAADNLVNAPAGIFARNGGRRDLLIPAGVRHPPATSADQVLDLLTGLLLEADLPPAAVSHYVGRLAVIFSSCDARRIGEWEHVRWSEFMGTDRFSDDYRKIFIDHLSEVLQASKTERTSAHFSGHFLELYIYNILGANSNSPVFRFLNLPTNEAMIDPWLRQLRSLGARLRNRQELARFVVRDGRIAGARVRKGREVRTVRADWYVCALPVERARRLWSPAILKRDPSLRRMRKLDTGWMNGMKFFLREERPLVEGVINYVDSPWRITSVSQAQFWPVDFARTYGDGRVRESLSAIISDWTTPGVLYGKPARRCSPGQVATEVWEQMKRHLNDTGEAPLTDEILHSWDIDPGMAVRDGHLVSKDPLVLPAVGQRPDRPDVDTAIPNLVLTGDYLTSEWHVANMEAASYNGRRAANAVLAKAGSREDPAAAIAPYRPPEWEPFKRIDEERFEAGQPNLFDTELPAGELRQLLRKFAWNR